LYGENTLRVGYEPQEVVSAEVVQTRPKSEFPGQRRNYNYVVLLNTVNAETGEPIMVNEYRSIASNQPLSSETVINRMVELIEENL
jgi:hypothetical protein